MIWLWQQVVDRLAVAGVADLLAPQRPGEHGTLWVTTATADLRAALVARAWIEDPLPTLRRRHKPWVCWSLREPTPGTRLHLEATDDGYVVHLDVLSPGRWWVLHPLHVVVDLWGWSTLRPRLLSLRR